MRIFGIILLLAHSMKWISELQNNVLIEGKQHPLNQGSEGQPNHDPPTNYIGLRPLPRHSGWRMEY